MHCLSNDGIEWKGSKGENFIERRCGRGNENKTFPNNHKKNYLCETLCFTSRSFSEGWFSALNEMLLLIENISYK